MKITKKLIEKIMEGEYREFDEEYEVTDPEEIVKNFLSTKAYTKAGMDDSQRAEFARGLVNNEEFVQYIIDGEVFHAFGNRMFNSNDEEVDPNDPTKVIQAYSGPAKGTLTSYNSGGSVKSMRSTGGYVAEDKKMKITKKELNDIIKEEASMALTEAAKTVEDLRKELKSQLFQLGFEYYEQDFLSDQDILDLKSLLRVIDTYGVAPHQFTGLMRSKSRTVDIYENVHKNLRANPEYTKAGQAAADRRYPPGSRMDEQ